MAIPRSNENSDLKAKDSESSVEIERRRNTDLPTHDEIALLAYGLYIESGATEGREVDDWLRAERELLERRGNRETKSKSATA